MTDQLELFPHQTEPIKVSERWKFDLAYIDTDGNPDHYLYAAIDWYVALGGSRASWHNFKNGLVIPDHKLPSLTTDDYTASNGRTYQMDYVNEADLYTITIEMRAMESRPQLAEIRKYLADAGVLRGRLERHHEQTKETLTSADKRLLNAKVNQGYSQDEARKFLSVAKDGRVTRNQLTDALKDCVIGACNYPIATDTEYKGLFNRTAKEISKATGLKNARDGMTTEARGILIAAESTIARLLKDRETVTFSEALEIIRHVGTIYRFSVEQAQLTLGIDLATGQALLRSE